MGEGTSSRRRSLGPGHHRARHRATSPGHECKAHPVLRRWVSLRTRGGESAEDGLQQRRINGRRVEGLAGSGLADRQRLATSGRTPGQRKLAGAEGFGPSPSSLTVRCPTSWTTPRRTVFAAGLPGRSTGTHDREAPPQKERRWFSLRYHDPALGKCPGQKCSEKSLNFFIRRCISIREDGRERAQKLQSSM